MSIFISIGNACNVKYQIDKNTTKKETLFFDWLMTDMQSVVKVFEHYNNIDEILNLSTVKQDINNPPTIFEIQY